MAPPPLTVNPLWCCTVLVDTCQELDGEWCSAPSTITARSEVQWCHFRHRYCCLGTRFRIHALTLLMLMSSPQQCRAHPALCSPTSGLVCFQDTCQCLEKHPPTHRPRGSLALPDLTYGQSLIRTQPKAILLAIGEYIYRNCFTCGMICNTKQQILCSSDHHLIVQPNF